MAVPIIMPRQGQSVESCIIGEWFKKKGDYVKEGEVLFSYETDKAAFEEESKVSGTILEIYAEVGDDVPVLETVCVIGQAGEDISSFGSISKDSSSEEVLETSINSKTDVDESVVNTEVQTKSEGEIMKISPRAKNLAEKIGIDYRFAKGSGPYGRIIENDIIELKEKGILVTSAAKDHLGDNKITGSGLGGRITTKDLVRRSEEPIMEVVKESVPVNADYEEVKLTNIRKVIAKAMHNSISSTAQLTLNSSFDATEVMKFRSKLKESKDRLGLNNITLNDIVAYAVSRTLMNHKYLNANFLEDKMRYYKNGHIGIAVDTERGLMVPTIFNANLKSLNQISAEIKALAAECQKGTINPDLLKGASFTISNLGSLDIESFTPVLNPPQTGILGVCNITQRVKEEDGEFKYYPAMGLSLTFDHRALDGAPAAKFLKELKVNLENFSTLLAK